MALPAELMQNVPTIEEFWAVFTKSREEAAREREEEAKAREAEAKTRAAEAKAREEEAKAREEAAAKAREVEAKTREAAAKAREEAEAKRQEKWDHDIEEVQAIYRKAARIVARVGKEMGDLNNRFGELAEHLVAPGIVRHFNELGYHFGNSVIGRLKILDGPGQKVLTEIDLLMENGEYSIAVEVKSRPTLKDIAHHEKRLAILREYKDKQKDGRKILGAIAGAVFPDEVKKAVIEAGLYVIEQSGDTMRVNIPEGFEPREW
ncbi:MAG: hypothetical protein LBR93_06370 [Treponema sp.]|nr:hypothetical protein [Treponema sp.]